MTKDRQQSTETAVGKDAAGQTDSDFGSATTEALRAAVREAKALLLALEVTGATHIAVRVPGAEIEIERTPGTVISPAVATRGPGVNVPESNSLSAEAGVVVVSAPLVGIFFRASSPGSKPFVEVGQPVSIGQQVGIIEAMKVMNEVVSDVQGVVAEILVADGTAVCYEQALMRIDVSATGGDAGTGD
jgi:acetyl-CoA carboxylase biotin carboxyl carrier protein